MKLAFAHVRSEWNCAAATDVAAIFAAAPYLRYDRLLLLRKLAQGAGQRRLSGGHLCAIPEHPCHHIVVGHALLQAADHNKHASAESVRCETAVAMVAVRVMADNSCKLCVAVGPDSGEGCRVASPVRSRCNARAYPNHYQTGDVCGAGQVPNDRQTAAGFSNVFAYDDRGVSAMETLANHLSRKQDFGNVDRDSARVARIGRSIQNVVLRTLSHPCLRPHDREVSPQDEGHPGSTCPCDNDSLRTVRAMKWHVSHL
jgi:hypothetical protein